MNLCWPDGCKIKCIFVFKHYIVQLLICFYLKKQEKKENNEKKEAEKAIILKALVHCEGCSDQICKCLKGLAGNFFHCTSLLITRFCSC